MSANESLTDQSPIDPNGPEHGPETPTAAIDAHVALVWCRPCDRDVVPIDGHCPRCGKMTRGNTARAKDKLDSKRVAYWLRKYTHRYKPRDGESADLIEELAEIRVHREVVRKGSAEWARLMEESRKIKAELKALRSENTIDGKAKLADLSVDQLSDRAQRLLHRAAELREFTTPRIEAATGSPIVTTPTSAPVIVPPIATPAPDSRCPCCNALESSCTDIRNDVQWLTEHQNRPDVRAHLDAQAEIRARLGWEASIARDPITRGRSTEDDPTAVMLARIKFGNPY